MKKIKYKKIIPMTISLVGMMFMGVCFYMICRYRPWIGDDALHCFTGGLSCYVHPEYAKQGLSDQHLGEYFTSLSQALSHATEYYVSWGGRLLTGVMDPLMVIGGKSASAVVSVCTYMGIILLGFRLVYGSIKEVFRHPLILLSTSSLLLFYNAAMDELVMRCMVNLYGFSFLLYLAILNLYEHILKSKGSINVTNVVLINVLGVVAGVSHELVGAWFLFQFMFGTFIRTRSVKKTLINCRYLAGTIIGYIICIVAPGNFARAKSPHEGGKHPDYF